MAIKQDLKEKYPGIIEDCKRWECGFTEAIARRQRDRSKLTTWVKTIK